MEDLKKQMPNLTLRTEYMDVWMEAAVLEEYKWWVEDVVRQREYVVIWNVNSFMKVSVVL